MEPSVIEIFDQNKGRYGARRIAAEHERKGIIASHKRAARILFELELFAKGCRKHYRWTKLVSDSGENFLNRELDTVCRN